MDKLPSTSAKVWTVTDTEELQTKFFEAIYQNSARRLAECISSGLNPNIKDEEGLAGLHHAAIRGDVPLGLVLFSSPEIDINITDVDERITPLMYACMYEHEEFVLELLKRGANPNLMNDKQQTALHIACTLNNVAISSALISNGAQIDIPDAFDNTPLSIAIIDRGSIPLTCLLLENGANANNTRQFPLFLDALLNCNTTERLKTIELLLMNNVSIYCLHPITKRNCLHFLGITGYLPAAELLLPLGESNLDQEDFTGRKPIDVARDHGNLEVHNYFAKWKERKLLPPKLK